VDNYADATHAYISYRIMSELDPDLRITAGKAVPEFELSLIDNGQVVSRSSMLGKHYLLDFWATWCGPCLGEMPHLQSAYEKFRGDGFEIISISFDESVEDVREFRAEKWKMPWLHAYLEGGFTADMAGEFEVSGIPKPILVDPEGTILAAGPELRGDRL
jgi:thiol-disulfide isomerase/thioredoxin